METEPIPLPPQEANEHINGEITRTRRRMDATSVTLVFAGLILSEFHDPRIRSIGAGAIATGFFLPIVEWALTDYKKARRE